jgi:hypothetical protein
MVTKIALVGPLVALALALSASASASAEPAVRNLRITPGHGSLVLHWNATHRADIDGFRIRWRAIAPFDRSTGEASRLLAVPWSTPVELRGGARRYTVTGLTAEPYEVKVRAISSSGRGGQLKGVATPLEGTDEPPAEEPAEEPPAEEEPAAEEPVEEQPAEEAPEEERPRGPVLFISPSGKDSNPCSEDQPCLTMGHAYERASAGQTVQLLAGSYPGQTIPGTSKAGSAHVVFSPAPGASVAVTNTIYVFGSHVTIEGLAVKDVVTGNYDQSPGRPNPTDVSLLNLTGRNFEIDSASNVTVEGGSWGPASACGGPYGGNNNSIRQTIPAVTPENILINDTIIHDVQSYDLIECHIEGLAIFAGNHVTVSNSKFYGNSIYDVFMQANSGGSPNNVTIAKNWMANSVDNSGANGHPAGYANGIVLGSEISSNLTLSANRFNGVVNINDDGSMSSYTGTSVLENFGAMSYSGYPCASTLKGVLWSKNVWQNDKCGATDVNLAGAALPYVKASNDRSLDYTLTGAYADWPAE